MALKFPVPSSREFGRKSPEFQRVIRRPTALIGTESLRRTRATHILSETGNMEAVRLLLGHSDIGSTARYLGAVKQPDPLAISKAYVS